MEKKNKVDGISLAIVILNIAIVAVLILLVTLIYLYMTGKLESTDVANMEQSDQPAAAITTTALTTDTVKQSSAPEESTESSEETENTEEEPAEEASEEDTTVSAEETDDYDEAFFANDLFIGDSIYTGLVNYGYFDKRNVFAEVGLNPETVFTKTDDSGMTAITKAEDMQPKRIFIMLGSNGLAFMGNTHMAEKMRELVDTLGEKCPDSYIYVVSIPPVTKAHDADGQETMVMVNGYNKLLKSMCEEAGIVYLNLCDKLENSSGYFSEDYAEADGMHFLGSAYKHMLSFFQKTIQL